MNLKAIALTAVTTFSLVLGTSRNAEAVSPVKENKALAVVSLTMFGVLYEEGQINEENFMAGVEAITQAHQTCRDNRVTCKKLSKAMDEGIRDLSKNMTSQQLDKIESLATSDDVIKVTTQVLGY